MRAWWALALAGCYNPDTTDCAYFCAPAGDECPSDQHCVSGKCRDLDQDTACPEVPLGWTFAPINFDPADPYVVTGGPDWNVASGSYDTDAPVTPAGTPPPHDVAGVRWIRVANLTITE